MPTHDANLAELQTPATTTDWSGWERWLRGHLDRELQTLHAALGALLASERRKFEARARELEFTVAKLIGAVDVLRGAAPPPPAKFPAVKAWGADTICHEGDVVAFGGGTFQALRDTAHAPGAKDWVCLAVGFSVRGKYLANETYRRGDVVMLDGASFVATKDAPGVWASASDARHARAPGTERPTWPHGDERRAR